MTRSPLGSRAAAEADATDPLAAFVERFERPDTSVTYLDGNSLGRPPVAARARAAEALDRWAGDLVGAWDRWIDRGLEIGDRLAPVLGAGSGQVLVAETTTVALFQAVVAALDARPDRRSIVACADDFPTDRYVVDGIARTRGLHVRRTPVAALGDAIDDDTAVVVASAAHFESAELADLPAVTATAHRMGALVVWDCSHAAGAIALDLDAHDVDVAVGCSYKYLHGGPGAPAWTYVARRHHGELRQPIHGWFGQRDQFAMDIDYEPAAGMAGWRVGTPGILGLEVAAAGIDVVADAGIDAIRAKSLALGHTMLAAADEWFAPLGFVVASPRDDDHRGGHVALTHPDASRIVRAGRAAGVICDFRPPDIVRLGPGPLATSHRELHAGLERLRDVVGAGAHERLSHDPGRIT